MKATSVKRVERLQKKSINKSKAWVVFLKFDMNMLRTPHNMQKYFPDHDFSKPDRKT